MDKKEFGCCLSESIYSKFSAIRDLDPAGIISFDEDLLLAYAIAFTVLTKDKLINKDTSIINPIDRVSSNLDEEVMEELFSLKHHIHIMYPTPEEMTEIVRNIQEDSTSSTYTLDTNDYYTWVLDVIRDTIMHESSDMEELFAGLTFDNNLDNRKFQAIIPFDWFIHYLNINPIANREFNSYSILGFYYNQEEELNNNFTREETLKNTILYRININSDTKIKEQEIRSLITEKLLEYSKEEVTIEDLNNYSNIIPLKDWRYPVKYLVSFYKAKDKLNSVLQEKYPNISIDIKIDNRKGRMKSKINRELLPEYHNYQDIWTDLNNSLIKDSIKLIDTMIRLYNYLSKDLTNNSLDSRLEFIKTITGNDGIYSSDINVQNRRMEEAKRQLSLVFYYVYGINLIVVNDKMLLDEDYLSLLEEKADAGKKNNYTDYMLTLPKQEDNYLKAFQNVYRIGKHLYNISSRDDINDDIKRTITHNFYQAILNLLACHQALLEKYNFSRFYYNHRRRIENSDIHNDLLNQLNEMFSSFSDYTNTTEDKDSLFNLLKTIQTELQELEQDFVYGKCNGTEIKEIIRNCLAHPGRIHFDHNDTDKLFFTDYSNTNEKSGIVIIPAQDFEELLYESMNQFKNSNTYQR